MVMFMRPRAADAAPVGRTRGWTRFVVVACALAILLIGIAPDYTVRYAAVGVPRLGGSADSLHTRPPAPQRAALLH
jgi:hypothetical protein